MLNSSSTLCFGSSLDFYYEGRFSLLCFDGDGKTEVGRKKGKNLKIRETKKNVKLFQELREKIRVALKIEIASSPKDGKKFFDPQQTRK